MNRIFTHVFTAVLITLGLAAVQTAQAQKTAGTVIRTISLSTGTFTDNGSWHQQWVGSEISPAVTLTSSRKDMSQTADGKAMDLREGTAGTSTYIISTDSGWRVESFEMTFKGNSATNPVTVNSGSQLLVSSATTEQTLSVSGISEYQTASFTLSGNNKGISTKAIIVTLVPVTPEPYETVEIDLIHGAFVLGNSGQWSSLWQSTDNERKVFLASERHGTDTPASNMQPAASGVGLDLREGITKASTYVLSTAGSWRVTGFELTFRGNNAEYPVTVSGGGTTLTSSISEERTLRVDGVAYGSKATFSLSGNNQGITTTSFKVHLTPTDPERYGVSVFNYSGSQPYSTVYRIPALAYIPAGEHKGRLVAVNDFRPCGSDIGYGEVDLHISVSDDGGLHWTLPADPVDADGNHVADGDGQGTSATSNENRDCGFGDASIVADRETGELLMLGVCGRIPIGQATRAIPQGLATWRSKDGGKTWTPWTDITEYILGKLDNNCAYGAVDGLFFTAGRMVQSRYVKTGSHYRVYVVGGGRSASIPDTQCWVFYTDDFGQTWDILGDPYRPALTTGGSEPKCEELPDGSVLYTGRAAGGRTFNIFTYTDYEQGKGFWDKAEFGKMVTGAASCNGDALIVPVRDTATGNGAYLLLQSIPQHPTSRINVGINYKLLTHGYEDFGSAHAVATDWDGAYQVTALPSAYSSLALMENGTIGFIFEEDTYGRDYSEVYRNLSVEQITGGTYTYAPDAGQATALALTKDIVEGKLAAAEKTYADRTELLATLRNAAQAFRQAPSTENYLAFNRALYAVEMNLTGISDISPAAGAALSGQLYDLLGRKATAPVRGHIYIDADGKKAVIK